MRILIILLLLVGTARADVRHETGYRRGRPIKIALTTIDRNEVEVRTARAFQKMQAAAAADGVSLTIYSGFRKHDRQAQLYRAWRNGSGNRAARPGYSNHQSGRAIDLVVQEEAVFYWLTSHAKRYGFHRTVRDESWHWEYIPAAELARRTAAASR